jgi:dienelactone hydrolase
MAANGVGVFVYDKRGTGKSEGQYFQMFGPLSDDVVAAVRWLKTRSNVDTSHIGAAGFSQGGWIAPLAASKEPSIRFVLVGYGLATPVAAQDSLEAPLQLAAKGFDTTAIRQFQELNFALHRAALHRFADGWGEIESKLNEYRNAPWLKAMKGTPTWSGSLLAMGIERAKATVPALFQNYFEAYYDPMPALESLGIPMLWMLGAADITAPPGPTIALLQRLRDRGQPVETVIYPRTDHGLVEFEVKDGHRVITRYSPGSYPKMVSWLRKQAGLTPQE